MPNFSQDRDNLISSRANSARIALIEGVKHHKLPGNMNMITEIPFLERGTIPPFHIQILVACMPR